MYFACMFVWSAMCGVCTCMCLICTISCTYVVMVCIVRAGSALGDVGEGMKQLAEIKDALVRDLLFVLLSVCMRSHVHLHVCPM